MLSLNSNFSTFYPCLFTLHLEGLCLHKIQRIPLDNEWIAFGMTQAVDFKIYVKVWPLNGFSTTHSNI